MPIGRPPMHRRGEIARQRYDLSPMQMLPNEAEMNMLIMQSFTDLIMSNVHMEGAKYLRMPYIHRSETCIDDERGHERSADMRTNSQAGSATIYTFPARGRFARDDRRDDLNQSANLASAHASKAVLGDAWYHEEAIREDDPTRTN
jgi:Protein of unknown function (DUF2735)